MCREHLDALPPNTRDLSFGNSVYTIRFEERNKRPVFGHKYTFFSARCCRKRTGIRCAVGQLSAVRDFAISVSLHNDIIRMADEYGLRLLYKEEFHSIFAEHQDHDEFGELLIRMKVVDSNGESAMDEDQWEAASTWAVFFYLVVADSKFARHLHRIRFRETLTLSCITCFYAITTCCSALK